MTCSVPSYYSVLIFQPWETKTFQIMLLFLTDDIICHAGASQVHEVPPGTKTSGPAELKFSETGSKIGPSGSVEMIVNEILFSLPLWFLDPDYGGNCTVYWMRIQSIYCFLWNTVPALYADANSLGLYLCLQKAIPFFYHTSRFKMVINMIRPVEFIIVFLSHFSSCDMIALDKSSILWN